MRLSVMLSIGFDSEPVLCLTCMSSLCVKDLVNLYISQKGSLNETFALLYGLNVCRIVKSLHDCSIIHGDVKPDNFLLKT